MQTPYKPENPYQSYPKKSELLKDFVVVTCISNPVRYKSRYELYKKFADMCYYAGVKLITIEMAFGDRPFVITERDNLHHLQVRSVDELWHKENMLNLAMQYSLQIYPDTKYFAWVDADVMPTRPPKEWFEETWHQLQHYHVVQMFEHSIDLDPNYNQVGERRQGFIAKYFENGFRRPDKAGRWQTYDGGSYGTTQGHTGFAWAATKEAISSVGGLVDKAILGAGDWHMAHAFIGAVDMSLPHLSSPKYAEYLHQWQTLCERYIKRDVGFVSGTIYHYWHGKKADRKYWDRWRILNDNHYDPDRDLKPDAQGLLQLESWEPRQLMLRDQIRMYFRQRNEDSIDL